MLIIPCGFEKARVSNPVQARYLYTGSLFKAIWAKATTLDPDIRILSAGYGLITPETLVMPYDRKMNNLIATRLRETIVFSEHDTYVGHLLPEMYALAVPTAKALLASRLTLGNFKSALSKLPDGPCVYPEKPDGAAGTYLKHDEIKQKHRLGATSGICAFIKDTLLAESLDVHELQARMIERFGPPLGVSYMPTIRRQLKVQAERHDLVAVNEGGKYRFVKKSDI